MASADGRGRGIARRALSAQSLQWKRVADIRTRLGLPALAQQREILDETPPTQPAPKVLFPSAREAVSGAARAVGQVVEGSLARASFTSVRDPNRENPSQADRYGPWERTNLLLPAEGFAKAACIVPLGGADCTHLRTGAQNCASMGGRSSPGGRHQKTSLEEWSGNSRHEFARNTGRAHGDLVGVDLAISVAETLKNVIERDEQLKVRQLLAVPRLAPSANRSPMITYIWPAQVIQRSFIWYDGVDGAAHTVRAIMALSFAAPSRH